MGDETNNDLAPEQMAARIKGLESCLGTGGTLRFKVSEKGAVSVYGLGRFPVTLYLEQWNKLLSHADEIRAFIEANKGTLKTKDQVISQKGGDEAQRRARSRNRAKENSSDETLNG